MRRTSGASSCAVLVSLVLAAGCPGPGSGAGAGTGPTTTTTSTSTSGQPKKADELDKLMRTRMNKSYSQLVFLVFHAESADFAAISEESGRLSEAVTRVLELPFPPIVKSDQARSVYVDYNETLRRDNDKFVAATARQDLPAMSASLKKIGETCSACHHFFRVEIPK